MRGITQQNSSPDILYVWTLVFFNLICFHIIVVSIPPITLPCTTYLPFPTFNLPPLVLSLFLCWHYYRYPHLFPPCPALTTLFLQAITRVLSVSMGYALSFANTFTFVRLIILPPHLSDSWQPVPWSLFLTFIGCFIFVINAGKTVGHFDFYTFKKFCPFFLGSQTHLFILPVMT